MKILASFAAVLGFGLALALAAPSYADSGTPSINVCSAKKGGNYDFTVAAIAAQSQGDVVVNNINTKGSWENFDKLASGQCDAAIVQSDAWGVYVKANPTAKMSLEQANGFFDEYVHFFCNRESKIGSIKDLIGNDNVTVLIGENKSGTQVTWNGFVNQNADYGKVKTLPIGGTRALSMVSGGTEAQCALYVSGLHSGYMNSVNEQGATINLVKINDGALNDAKDPKGNPIYTFDSIPGGTYDKLQNGIFSTKVETLKVHSILVVRTEWIDANSDTYDAFLQHVLKAVPEITAHVNGQ